MTAGEQVTSEPAPATVRVDIPLRAGRSLRGDEGVVHVDIAAETVLMFVGALEIGSVSRETFRAWWRDPDLLLRAGAVRWSRIGTRTMLTIDFGPPHLVPVNAAEQLAMLI